MRFAGPGRAAHMARGRVVRVVSGGQTGVDRAALDAALSEGIPCGGWCPKGRRAEDGIVPLRYPLRETSCGAYRQRTEWNVRDSDGTLVVSTGEPIGGTALALRFAAEGGKPWLIVDPRDRGDLARAAAWIARHNIRTLNVAGARESESPGIHRLAQAFLRRLLTMPGGP